MWFIDLFIMMFAVYKKSNSPTMFTCLVVGSFTLAALCLYAVKRYCRGGRCDCTASLQGQVIIVTGGNSGIGKETAKELARRGGHIVLGCRSVSAGIAACEEIYEETSNTNIAFIPLDLNDFASIRLFAETFKSKYNHLNILINNAGVFYHPPQITGDGFDVTFQTNYLGPFLLTLLLLNPLKNSAPSCVVNVASEAHRYVKRLKLGGNFGRKTAADKYNRCREYGSSKLCLMLFTAKLSVLLKEKEVSVISVHPGSVETPIYRHFPLLSNRFLFALQKPLRYLVVRSPREGAQVILHAVLQPDFLEQSGKYFGHYGEVKPSELVDNISLRDELWDRSLQWCNMDAATLPL